MNAKKLLSYLLALAIVLTMATFPAIAADSELIAISSVTTEGITGDTAKIFDGLNGSAGRTGWESFKSAETIELGDGSSALYSMVFDLGETYAVTEIYSRWSIGYPLAGNIYATNNPNGEWTLIQSFSSTYVNEEDWCSCYASIAVDTDGTGYQYYKLEATKSNGAWDGNVGDLVASTVECFEVELMGTAVSAGPAGEPTTYTVSYVDAAGNNLLYPKTVEGVFTGQKITETAVAIDGYTVDVSSYKITLYETGNEIVFTYAPSTANDKIKLTTGNVINTPNVTKGAVADIVDGDVATFAGFIGWGDGGVDLTSNNVFEIDLGKSYDLSKVVINWGNKSLWGDIAPDKYTVYYAGDDGVYYEAAAYAEIYNKIEAAGLPSNMTVTYNGWENYTQCSLDVTEPAGTGVRYIKIEVNQYYGNGPVIREIGVYGKEYVDPNNNKTLTVYYRDGEGRDIATTSTVTKTAGKEVTVYPKYVEGYKVDDGTPYTVVLNEDASYTFTYTAIPQVSTSFAANGSSSAGATLVSFVLNVSTPTNVAPTEFDAGWVTDNCEVDSINVVPADNADTFVYEWKVIVNVVPAETGTFSVELDLTATEYDTVISFTRTPSESTLDSAVAVGENTVTLSTNKVVIELEDNGMVKTKKDERKVFVTLNLQTINADLLPYKGYDNVVIELKDIVSAGQGLTYKKENFVTAGNTCVGELLAHKYGIDQLSFVLAIYGVKADGTKVELDTATVKSEVIEVVAPDPKPTPTKAESISDKILPIDIIAQLYGQVRPSALPTITDADWDIYKEVVAIRESNVDIDAMKAEYDAYRVSEPTGEYTDDLVIDVNKQIEASVYLWNFLKDIKVDTITFTNLNVTAVTDNGIEAVDDIESVNVTFRNGIDYDNLNALKGGDFNLRIRINIDDSEQKANLIGKAYNAVRRALNDDQVMPLFFRLDWYTWADLPFTGAVFTVKVSEKWIDNNGAFNLVAYHLTPYTYDYEKDNTPTIEKVKDNLTITPITRELSFAVDGGSNGSKVYDTYVIVSTNKLPSELPETIG